jgi:energy-coupling factor transporter ATP-binding protein EcfA2
MLKVLLGKNVIDRPVYWEVEKEKNPHLLVLGTSGSGKTETLKAIIHDLNQANVPSLIIDFHNEFSGVGKTVLNLRETGINPLEFSENEKPENIIYEVSGIIKKIFGLGEIQESILRQAIKNSYLFSGIDLRDPGSVEKYPTFQDVKDNIYRLETSSNKRNIDSLMSRIEPLFELDIFHGQTEISFSELLGGTTVVELRQFPTETIKSAIAEFFLAKFSYYFYSLERSKKMKLYCVVDEAHRLMYEGSPLDRFLRESRKYGVGVILASQRPTDFNETVLANAGVLLSFQCTLEKDARFVGKQLGIDEKKIRNLVEPGAGYVRFSRGDKADRVKITRLKDRLSEEEKNLENENLGKEPASKKAGKEAQTTNAKIRPSPKKSSADELEVKPKIRVVPAPEGENLKENKGVMDEEESPRNKDNESGFIDSKKGGAWEDSGDELSGPVKKEGSKYAESEAKEEEPDSGGEEDYPEHQRSKNADMEKKSLPQNLKVLTGLFFYKDEPVGRKAIFRSIFVSLFFIAGIWLLLMWNELAPFFFIIGFIWTPFFAQILNAKEEHSALLNGGRILLSLILVYLFLIY